MVPTLLLSRAFIMSTMITERSSVLSASFFQARASSLSFHCQASGPSPLCNLRVLDDKTATVSMYDQSGGKWCGAKSGTA